MAIRGGELVSRCAWTGSGDVRHQGLKGLRGAKWAAPAEPKKGYWRLSEESSDNLKQHLTVLLNASGFFFFFLRVHSVPGTVMSPGYLIWLYHKHVRI